MSLLPQFRKGATVLVVQSAWGRGETYGYEIRREAYRKTKGLFTINEGALYPASCAFIDATTVPDSRAATESGRSMAEVLSADRTRTERAFRLAS